MFHCSDEVSDESNNIPDEEDFSEEESDLDSYRRSGRRGKSKRPAPTRRSSRTSRGRRGRRYKDFSKGISFTKEKYYLNCVRFDLGKLHYLWGRGAVSGKKGFIWCREFCFGIL